MIKSVFVGRKREPATRSLAEIERDKTMDVILMYIPNDDTQN